MCQSTWYLTVYPFKLTKTRAVVKALSQFISIFGIPKVIQSDQGLHFSSHMFGQELKLLHIKQNPPREKLCVSQSKMKKWYDHPTERFEFSQEDQVLTLMPIVRSLFQGKYTGQCH